MKDEKITTPAKVSVEVLREHFKQNYNLDGEQVELMLKSSSESLRKSLDDLYAVLDKDCNLEGLAKISHNIKGVLLNMGESEWAEIARTMETSAMTGKKIDYRSMVEHIHKGVEGVL